MTRSDLLAHYNSYALIRGLSPTQADRSSGQWKGRGLWNIL